MMLAALCGRDACEGCLEVFLEVGCGCTEGSNEGADGIECVDM